MKMNSMGEKQSLAPGPGSHLFLHTCQEEIQPERLHLPEIKGPGLRTVRPGAVPSGPAVESCMGCEACKPSWPVLFILVSWDKPPKWIRGIPLFPLSYSPGKQSQDTAVQAEYANCPVSLLFVLCHRSCLYTGEENTAQQKGDENKQCKQSASSTSVWEERWWGMKGHQLAATGAIHHAHHSPHCLVGCLWLSHVSLEWQKSEAYTCKQYIFLVNLFCKYAYMKGLFFMYSFMRFDTCLGRCNHHHNQDMKQLLPHIGALCSKTPPTL